MSLLRRSLCAGSGRGPGPALGGRAARPAPAWACTGKHEEQPLSCTSTSVVGGGDGAVAPANAAAATAATVVNTSRRGAAATAAAAAALWLLPDLPARAENAPLPKTCDGPDALLPYTDPSGRFKLARPCGWKQVTSLLPGSSVLASFYNPEEPGAETLAVYVAPAAEGVRRTGDLGAPQDVAASLASIAPNGVVMGSYGTTHGGRQYVIVHVQFGGNTAGMFGSAREFRAITVHRGNQYTLRVTSTRYRYLAHQQVRDLLKGASDAFELLL